MLNLVLYVSVCTVILRHTRSTLTRRHQPVSASTAARVMASIVSIMFLFGVSWLCAALTITIPHIRYTAQVLFTVFNSLQGFFCFLFFCVLNTEARESWKELLSCGHYRSKVLHTSEVVGRHKVHSSPGLGGGRGFGSFKCSSTRSTLTSLHAKHSVASLRTVSQSSIRTLDTPTFADTPTLADTTFMENIDTPTPTVAMDIATPTDIIDTPTSVDTTTFTIAGCSSEERPTNDFTGPESLSTDQSLNARVSRYSTLDQHVEEYQVDFYDSLNSEDQKTI